MIKDVFKIALIEDDSIMGESLLERLSLEGFEAKWFTTIKEASTELKNNKFHAVISDICLPDGNGEELLAILRKQQSQMTPIIFITGYGTIDQAVSLLKQGAIDYLTKPLEISQLLRRLNKIRNRAHHVHPESASRSLGISTAMQELESKLVRLIEHPKTPVLFYGESGTGKEVAARYLHTLQCPEAPFEAINCASIPDTLIASELFGHEKGTFTGADKQRIGLYERAQNGFVLLDEIGDMPIDLQPVLLRVLQEGQFSRLGGKSSKVVEARNIFATHQNLKQLVLDKKFRQDLYYRINVIQIEILPLRERKEDISWLAERFVHQHNMGNPEHQKRLTSDALDYLEKQQWPGNVRELLNAIQRACILSDSEILSINDFNSDMTLPPTSHQQPLNHYLQNDERGYIIAALKKNELKITKTAEVLGLSRKGLWQKMKKLNIQKDKL
jgi:DNA-binding NtrC family response regulator